MNERITKIEAVNDYENNYDGYLVETTKQKIYVLISNGQNCCEQWGTLSTLDDFNDFVGTNLLKVEIVDTELNKKEAKKDDYDRYNDEDNSIFVNFETSNGTFQLTCYNNHNGYYGHEVLVISRDLNHEGYL